MTIQTPPPAAPSTPPDEPSRSDQPAIFVSKADAFLAWFKELRAAMFDFVSWWPTFKGELDGTIATINTGTGIGLRYIFSATTADADPGAGVLRLSNATQNLATVVRMDLVDANGVNAQPVIDLFDDSSSVNKGTLKLQHATDPTKFLILNVTAVAAPAGYRDVTASVVASSAASPFVDGDQLLVSFVRNGDIATGTVSSTDVQKQQYTAFTTGGTGTAYTLTPTPALTAYAAGESFSITFHAASGTAPTLNVSGLGATVNLVKQLSDGSYVNIGANDIPASHRSRVTLLSNALALVEDMPPRPASRNRMINGGCRISQYGPVGLSGAGGITYGGCDRVLSAFTGTTVSATIVQAPSPFSPSIMGKFGFIQRIGVTSNTGSGAVSFQQRMESLNVADLNGRTVVASVVVHQDTGGTVAFTPQLDKPNAADNYAGTTNLVTGAAVNVPSGVPTRIAMSTTLGAADASNGLQYRVSATGLGVVSGKHFDCADWYFNLGATAPVEALEDSSIQEELTRCQRYFEKSYGYATVPGAAGTAGSHQTLANTGIFLQTGTIYFKQNKRIAPTMTFYSVQNANSAGKLSEYTTGAAFVADRTANLDSSTEGSFEVSGGSLTAGNLIRLHWTASSEL